jgi:hypothetical protein
MGFFDRIFNTDTPEFDQPKIKFGRYSDAYKTAEQYTHWESSLKLFDKKEYVTAYDHFFQYLYNEDEENVSWNREGDTLHFKILQGSKLIKGDIDDKVIRVETKVAQVKAPGVGFMRRLVEKNYDLKYSRFAIDESNHIVLVFNSFLIDGSPYKLYYALKELSTQADKIDDLLLDEFDVLKEVDSECKTEIDVQQKEVKYNFIISHIEEVLTYLDKDNIILNEYPGGVAYLLLDLCYKLDCLTRPEGFMMESLERIHRFYFAKNTKKTVQRNVALIKEFRKLAQRSKEEYFKEMYDVSATFGITTSVEQAKVVAFIEGEIHNMDWYNENGHSEIALAVPGYIIGYCMFNYAVPKPVRDLFILYYQIIEFDYFTALGYSAKYVEGGKLQKRSIKQAIEIIAKRHQEAFPNLDPATRSLDFDSKQSFAKSYLLMIHQLNLYSTIS